MSDGILYETCSVSSNGDMNMILQCVTATLEERNELQRSNVNSWLLIVAGGLVFFMQCGFAMLCAGAVRKKNVQNTMLKNLLDACGAAVSFYLIGYAFSFGGGADATQKTFIGTSNFFSLGDIDPAFWFFQYAFSATSVTIVAGTLAERCQMAAYLCYSIFLVGFVYPVVAHAIWSQNGFLSTFNASPFNSIGVLDFAGSGVVHLTGGTTACIATYILGPRRGRFYDSRGKPLDKPKPFPGHSMALQLQGTMILWFGWYGFNPGSALLLGIEDTGTVAATAAINTSLAASCASISALFTNLYIEERKTGEYSFDLSMAMNGALGGLVAITAGCGTVEMWGACVVGLIAGWLYIGASKLLIHVKLDDAVDAIPVHMVNGMWGLLATGLLSSPAKTLKAFGSGDNFGFLYHVGRGEFDITLLCNQSVACLFIVGWTFSTMAPFFIWLNYQGWFRSDSLEELVGLDISYHGGRLGEEETIKDEHVQALKKRHSKGRITSSAHSVASESEADLRSWAEMTTDRPESALGHDSMSEADSQVL